MIKCERFSEFVNRLIDDFGEDHVDVHEFEGVRTVYIRAGRDKRGRRLATLTIEFHNRGGWYPLSVGTSIPVYAAIRDYYPDVNYERDITTKQEKEAPKCSVDRS